MSAHHRPKRARRGPRHRGVRPPHALVRRQPLKRGPRAVDPRPVVPVEESRAATRQEFHVENLAVQLCAGGGVRRCRFRISAVVISPRLRDWQQVPRYAPRRIGCARCHRAGIVEYGLEQAPPGQALVGATGVLLLAATVLAVGALNRHQSTSATGDDGHPEAFPPTPHHRLSPPHGLFPRSAPTGPMPWVRRVCRSWNRRAPGVGDRSLPTAVFYPVRGIAAAGGPDAQPDRTHAPYPLLVFSQGYDLSVQAYSTLLTDWASAGFVVAAPTYPHTDPSDQRALDENDITNHPADLRLCDHHHARSCTRVGITPVRFDRCQRDRRGRALRRR